MGRRREAGPGLGAGRRCQGSGGGWDGTGVWVEPGLGAEGGAGV